MNRSLEEEIKIRAEKARGTAKYMASMEDLVEERIRKAMESGAFDNLEGKGKPLDLSENPFEPDDMHMANKILKDHGFVPYWMELGKDVDAAIEKLWGDVKRFETRLKVKAGSHQSQRRKIYEDKQLQKFLQESIEALRDINRKIDNYNCHCPMWWLGRGRLNINEEMRKVRERLGVQDSEG